MYQCGISDMVVVKETRYVLKSIIHLCCKMCGIKKNLELSSDNEQMMDPNTAMVLGTISSGNGFTAAQSILTSLEVPFVSFPTYQKIENSIADVVHETAWKTMEEAGQDEANIARSLGEVDDSNIPYITVIADGAWSKRSYSTNYDASSGVVSLFLK